MQAGPQKSRMTRGRTLVWTIVFGACGGSTGHGAAAPASGSADQANAATGAAAASGTPGAPAAEVRPPARTVSEAEALKPRDDLPPAQRAMAIVDGKERWIDAGLAEAAGFTLVDLSDDWTPYILARADVRGRASRCRTAIAACSSAWPTISSTATVNRCRRAPRTTSSSTASPPAFSVLRARFLQDAEHPCHDQESADALEAVETVSYVAPEAIKREEHRLARIRAELEIARAQGQASRRWTSWRRSSRSWRPRSSCWPSAPRRSRRWRRSSAA